MKLRWQDTLVTPQTSILQVMKVIDGTSCQCAIVVDEAGCLTGTVTDGDIRRGILKGIPIQGSIDLIMNKNPRFANVDEEEQAIISLMRNQMLHQIPVVDAQKRVIRVEYLNELTVLKKRENMVVLMAGGKGQRLKPLTDNCPKPMLKVGDKPILETIINKFRDSGFYKFVITVNYKAEVVKAYFGDGSKFHSEITYVDEDQPLGTAGSLGLLKEMPSQPLIVMNADLLTAVNFGRLLDFHVSQNAAGTMCVREYDLRVPYGVVTINDNVIQAIDEKPVQKFFVNAGVYVLQPEALLHVPKNKYLDMPSLFDRLMTDKPNNTLAYPIREYWLDIGQLSDFEKANFEFHQVF